MSAIEQDPRDVEQIKQLKAKYFRYLDTKRWNEWRQLFSDDAQVEDSPEGPRSIDGFATWVAKWLQAAVTVHQGHMPEIILINHEKARGIWALAVSVEFSGPIIGGRGDGYRGYTGFGHYEEEYSKQPDGWRISFMRITMIRANPIVGAPQAELTGWAPRSNSDWLTLT